jgi:hypothetical protein
MLRISRILMAAALAFFATGFAVAQNQPTQHGMSAPMPMASSQKKNCKEQACYKHKQNPQGSSNSSKNCKQQACYKHKKNPQGSPNSSQQHPMTPQGTLPQVTPRPPSTKV